MIFKALLWLMAALYVVAGINHFVHPAVYIAIMPSFLPVSSYSALVVISGICEILFGLLLLPPPTRRVAAWLVIALLLAVFPANIQMALNFSREHNPDTWLAYLRLPLQIVLIIWACRYTRQAK
jgi:uncharacterized membrane protein